MEHVASQTITRRRTPLTSDTAKHYAPVSRPNMVNTIFGIALLHRSVFVLQARCGPPVRNRAGRATRPVCPTHAGWARSIQLGSDMEVSAPANSFDKLHRSIDQLRPVRFYSPPMNAPPQIMRRDTLIERTSVGLAPSRQKNGFICNSFRSCDGVSEPARPPIRKDLPLVAFWRKMR